MYYPVAIEQDGDAYLVTFPDIPEAITSGETVGEALAMAADALVTAFEFYFEDDNPIPMPSARAKGQRVVEVPPSVWAKVLLLNAILEEGVTRAELARRIGIKRQEMNRVVNLGHTTKIDTIAKGLAALGRHLSMGIEAPVAEPA